MIEIVPFQDRWKGEFEILGSKIRQALGDRALFIHHIGSTSVHGLTAKDVIDLQVTVSNLENALEELLLPLGFERSQHTEDHCPPGLTLNSKELAKRHYRGKPRAANLHIRADGAFNQCYPLLFRDYLRATPMASSAYGEIKKQLAAKFPDDADAYYDIKDPVCDALMTGAKEWAKTNSWKPGPSEA